MLLLYIYIILLYSYYVRIHARINYLYKSQCNFNSIVNESQVQIFLDDYNILFRLVILLSIHSRGIFI